MTNSSGVPRFNTPKVYRSVTSRDVVATAVVRCSAPPGSAMRSILGGEGGQLGEPGVALEQLMELEQIVVGERLARMNLGELRR